MSFNCINDSSDSKVFGALSSFHQMILVPNFSDSWQSKIANRVNFFLEIFIIIQFFNFCIYDVMCDTIPYCLHNFLFTMKLFIYGLLSYITQDEVIWCSFFSLNPLCYVFHVRFVVPCQPQVCQLNVHKRVFYTNVRR